MVGEITVELESIEELVSGLPGVNLQSGDVDEFVLEIKQTSSLPEAIRALEEANEHWQEQDYDISLSGMTIRLHG